MTYSPQNWRNGRDAMVTLATLMSSTTIRPTEHAQMTIMTDAIALLHKGIMTRSML